MCGAYGMENVTLSEDDHMYFYTFSAYDDVNERMVDLSLSGMVNYNNMVGSWDNVFVLLPDGNGDDLSVNNNTFISGCNGNMLYVYVKCDNNTFNSNCKYNIITGYDNTLGNNCCYNVLYMSNSNIFEDGCNKNLLYFYTNYNKFGNNCESNTLMLCHTNTFENNCKSNTLVSNCSYNIFKNNCESNIIAYGSYNVFGNCCCYNILGQHNYHITFGNNCSYNTFGSPTNDHPEESTYCVQNITFGGGCEYLDINCSVQSTSKYLQNVNISQGVCGTSSSKLTITIPNRGLAYETSVAKDSSGNLQIYNPADLAALLVGGYDAFFTKS